MQITFQADSLPQLASQVIEAAKYFDSQGVNTPLTTNEQMGIEDKAVLKPVPTKKTRAKKEVVETAPQETLIGEVLADAVEETPIETATEKLDLEKDIIPAVQAFVKKTEAKVGRDKALLQVKNILEKFNSKSIRDVSADQYPELMKWFA